MTRSGRGWLGTLPAGLATAIGLIPLALGWYSIGWPALPVLLLVGRWAGRRIDRPVPTAGLVRGRPRPSAWTVWAIALAAGLWLTLRPDPTWPVVLLAGAAATATTIDRLSDGLAGGLFAPACGYLALFFAGYLLIATSAPLAALAVASALLAAWLTLDLVPRSAGVRRPIFAVVMGLALAQTSLLLALLPLQPWAEAALAVSLAYSGIGVLAQAARQQFSGRVAVEYAAVLVVGVLSIGVWGR